MVSKIKLLTLKISIRQWTGIPFGIQQNSEFIAYTCHNERQILPVR